MGNGSAGSAQLLRLTVRTCFGNAKMPSRSDLETMRGDGFMKEMKGGYQTVISLAAVVAGNFLYALTVKLFLLRQDL